MSESKIRMVKPVKPFTMILNAVLRDKNLSLKAKGLYAVMVSLPDDWEYTVSGLATICYTGRDAIRSTLVEMEKAGYLERRQSRPEAGKFGGCEYIAYESPRLRENPSTDNPSTAYPAPDAPQAVIPITGNPAQYTKDSSMGERENTPPTPVVAAGGAPKRKRRAKSVATWEAESFEAFWTLYPRDEERYKAVEEWDKLKPNQQLRTEIMDGLNRAKRCKNWQEGYIPYAWRWLRDGRWTENQRGPGIAQSAPDQRAGGVILGPR